MSLQGIVNRRGSHYMSCGKACKFGNLSVEWLKYYELKDRINYGEISIESAFKIKYRQNKVLIKLSFYLKAIL